MSELSQQELKEKLTKQFIKFAEKIDYPISESRIPFTYHHDHVRSEATESYSRGDIAQKLSSSFDRNSNEYMLEAFNGAIHYLIKNTDRYHNSPKETNSKLAEEMFDFFDADKMPTVLTTLINWKTVEA